MWTGIYGKFPWQFIEYESEGSILLLQTCLNYLNRNRTDGKNGPLEKVVAAIFKCLLDRPNFITVFCESLRNSEISEGMLENFSNALHLPVIEKICIGLALSDSEHSESRICGKFNLLGPVVCWFNIFLLIYLFYFYKLRVSSVLCLLVV